MTPRRFCVHANRGSLRYVFITLRLLTGRSPLILAPHWQVYDYIAPVPRDCAEGVDLHLLREEPRDNVRVSDRTVPLPRRPSPAVRADGRSPGSAGPLIHTVQSIPDPFGLSLSEDAGSRLSSGIVTVNGSKHEPPPNIPLIRTP